MTAGMVPSSESSAPALRMLALVAVCELLAMSLWFAGTAVGPQLGTAWGLHPESMGFLTSAVQLGFVIGTAGIALFNLGDVLPAKRLFAASALLGALANLGVAFTTQAGVGFSLRALTGVAMAGVYPPAMKMVATWFKAQRGLAVGIVVGAVTVGSASPWLVRAFLPHATAASVLLLSSVSAALAAVLVLFYHDGPFAFSARPFSWRLVSTVVGSRRWRLATGGYLGHMFELYSVWAWASVWMAESLRPNAPHHWLQTPEVFAFITIASGSFGCILGGRIADRRGRPFLVTLALAVSGACSLGAGAFFGAGAWGVTVFAVIWGASLAADSPQFSVMVTESVEPHAVGTALSLQTSLGFVVTLAGIQLMPVWAQSLGWRWAFSVLAIGPALAIASIRRLSTRAK